jgi:hypothetical protein
MKVDERSLRIDDADITRAIEEIAAKRAGTDGYIGKIARRTKSAGLVKIGELRQRTVGPQLSIANIAATAAKNRLSRLPFLSPLKQATSVATIKAAPRYRLDSPI